MSKHKTLRQILLANMLLVATLACVSVGSLWIGQEIYTFNAHVTEESKRLIEERKERMQKNVDSAVAYLDFMRGKIEERARRLIHTRTLEAHQIATHLYETWKDKKSRAELESMVREALRPIRFIDGRGYYFATRLDGVEMLCAACAHLEGKNLLDLRDTQGAYVIRDMAALVRKEGEGFYRYTWNKPETPGREHHKIAYVKHFAPFDWFIGTGEYIEDTEQDMQQEALEWIRRIRYDDAYLFAGRWDGTALSGPATGKNMLGMTDLNGVKVVQEMIRLARENGGFVEYLMPKIEGQSAEPKISYTRGLPAWEWYIGTGLYIDDIENMVAESRQRARTELFWNIAKICAILALLWLAAFWLAARLNVRTHAMFQEFSGFFNRADKEQTEIPIEMLAIDEFRELAEGFNRVQATLRQRETALQETQATLQAAMDQSPAGIAIASATDGSLRYINDAGLRIRGDDRASNLTGLDLAEYYTRRPLLDFDGRPLEPDEIPMNRAAQFGEVCSREFMIQRLDGTNRIVESTAAPIKNAAGEVIAGIAIFLDITERKANEVSLRDSEESLNITLNSIGDAVIATDVHGCITRMNPTAERLTGWPLAEAINQQLTEVFRIINADTRMTVPDPVTLVMTTGQIVGLANHTVLVARDGQEFQIADSAAPIRNAGGEILGVVLVFSDVTEKYQAEKALHLSRFSLETASDALFWIMPDARIVDVNAAGCRSLEYTRAELLKLRVPDVDILFNEELWPQHFSELRQRGTLTFESEQRTKSGKIFPVEIVANYIKHGDEEFNCAFVRDITERKRADEALRISEERYRMAFQTSQDVININRLSDGLLIEANQSFLDIHGFEREEIIGRTTIELNLWFDPADRRRFVEVLQRDSKCSNFEARFRRKNGELLWGLISAIVMELDDVPCVFSIRRDITERKLAEEKINYLAYFDQLTGLPNRTLLQDRLKQAMANSQRSGRYGALLLLDLDYFKTLNDTLGHDMGDLLLKQVAQRLTDCVREEDTVARFGGDEFVVMLVSLSENQSEAASLADLIGAKISAAFNLPFDLKEISYRISPSLGASLFLGQQTDIDMLLKQADLAMYKAKEAGRNTLRFFDPDMAHDVLKRAALDNDLRDALQHEQFVLHYQAQMTGKQVTGVEVLLRWQHPERGLVFPGEFITAIEESGQILPVGQWVLESACQQLAAWAKQPEMSHLTVAVNISAHQLNHEDFVDQVLRALELSGAIPNRLKLELTESLLVNNVEEIIGKMIALKAKGVKFSLDDFGTGYSSLAYLKRLPLDQLKIDQSFVRDILTDPNDAAIARMIVVLAETLGLAVIAEGVETEAQRDSLTQQGCHGYQGYLFSRPVPLDEFESFVKRV